MTVSDAIIQGLTGWGLQVIFGLPADGVNGLMEALRSATVFRATPRLHVADDGQRAS